VTTAVKTISWTLQIHYLVFSMKVKGNPETKSFFLIDWVTESFEASKCFCSFKIAHEGSYPCSRIHQVKNNELNWHASLPKASLVETHVWITQVSTLHVQYDFGKTSVSLWRDTLCSQRRRRYEVQTPSRQKVRITCPNYWRKAYGHVSLAWGLTFSYIIVLDSL